MYNRYVPQGDGTFQRNQMPDAPPRPTVSARQQSQRRQSTLDAPPPLSTPQSGSHMPPQPEPPHRESQPEAAVPRQRSIPQEDRGPQPLNQNASAFFSRFLPKNMDSGDLLMLMILLLLLSDGDEDAPPVLLTIALYFLLKTDSP